MEKGVPPTLGFHSEGTRATPNYFLDYKVNQITGPNLNESEKKNNWVF